MGQFQNTRNSFSRTTGGLEHQETQKGDREGQKTVQSEELEGATMNNNEDKSDELIRLRLEVETLRANREQFDERALELEATIARLTKSGPLREDLTERLIPLTNDEIEIVLIVLDKLNGEGRKEHEDLDHATDERSIFDWATMQLDEFVDTAFYSIGKRARRAKGLA